MEPNRYGWWLPLNASATGLGIDKLINLVHILIAVLFVGWAIYLVFVLIRFRARPGHHAAVPTQKFWLPTAVEIAVVVAEIALLVLVSSPIWFKIKNNFPAAKDAFTVRVIAEQYAWNIHYPGRDGRFGRTQMDLVTASNSVGLDRDDPAARDDIVTLNDFHIPVSKPIIVQLSSKDVIHSFFLPVLRVKQDAIPGMTIPLWFEAALTGSGFEIACSQLCGLGHYRMRANLSIDSPADFENWFRQQEQELLEANG